MGCGIAAARGTEGWARRVRRWVSSLDAQGWVARVAAWVVVLAGLLAYASVFRQTYIDDAFITFQYARNLAEHLSWGFFPDRPSNTATSPLNVVLLAAFDRALPGSTVDAAAWLNAATWGLTLAALLRISRRLLGGPHFALLAFVGLVTNPLLISGIGLEGYLYALLMVAAAALFLERRWWWLGLALGLLTLTRPDGLLLCGLLLLVLPGGLAARGKVALAFGLAVAPWFLYSWVALGSIVPDTLVIKLEQTAWGPTTFLDGFSLYRQRFPLPTAASLWPAALAPFAVVPLWRAGREARSAFAALVAYAAIHYAVYGALAVPPYHWYYTHQVVPLVLVGALGAAYLLQGMARSADRVDRWAAVATTALPAAAMVYLGYGLGWPPRQAPIHSNWAAPGEYRSVGLWLHDNIEPGAILELRGEIGTLAYYSGRYLIDEFTDRNRANATIAELEAGQPRPMSLLLRANGAWRDDEPPFPPPTYLLDVVSGEALNAPSGPDVVAAWDVSSRWLGRSRIVLRSTAFLSIAVEPDGAGGAPTPRAPP